ncbi:uncharacterized protein DUF3331 [Paraburkholderia sp. BL23I1N1]|uniref:DUF3331 domain-containing protein n=1 Tax=Paraburkholderia sp. BL23I1N1 TaxID=1938802 RepID=UPI000E76F220|nr:DUF3331 domain-containing protein [Paraburkholderia sp. BL23I1N1]RKE35742.1 uncharacterized protein DUF3331 [Paraburkholderia sp. BL23I1N1]
MLANANFTDPWMQTLGLLSVLSGDTDAGAGVNELAAEVARNGRKNCALPVMGQRFEVQVHVIDRPSQSTATVIWRDPTRCSYGDQVWHASRARVSGVCAMSGRAIQPGDAIYKPRPCRPAPLNTGAMILRTVLDKAVAL